jgi:hypothetical protein
LNVIVLCMEKALRILTEQKFDDIWAPMEVNLKNVCSDWQFKIGHQNIGSQGNNFQKYAHIN